MRIAFRARAAANSLKTIPTVVVLLLVSLSFYPDTYHINNLSYVDASTESIQLGFAHVAGTAQNSSFVYSLSHVYNLKWADDPYLPPGDPYYHHGTYEKLVNNSINILGNMFPLNQTQAAGNTICYSITSWDQYVLNNLRNYTAITSWEIGQEYPFNFGDGNCSPAAPYAFSRYGGNFSESASAYAVLLKSAYEIIKANAPNAVVHCLVSDLFGSGYPIKNSTTWAADVWADGAGNYCDVVDLHEYSWPFLMDEMNTQVWPHEMESTLVNDTLYQYESITRKPIWITETGYQSRGSFTVHNGTTIYFSPSFQADGLQQEYNFYLHIPFIKGIFWYQTMDDNYSTCTNACYFGLFDDLGNPKIALSTWTNFNNSNLTTTSSSKTTTASSSSSTKSSSGSSSTTSSYSSSSSLSSPTWITSSNSTSNRTAQTSSSSFSTASSSTASSYSSSDTSPSKNRVGENSRENTTSLSSTSPDSSISSATAGTIVTSGSQAPSFSVSRSFGSQNFLGLDQKRTKAITCAYSTSAAILIAGLIFLNIRKKS